jgi:hypothetical protein
MSLDKYHAVIKLINLSCDVREIKYSGRYNFSYDLVSTATSTLRLFLNEIEISATDKINNLQLNSFDDVVNHEKDQGYKNKLHALNEKFKKISTQHDCSFIIHGSLGDGCYVKGWSDVDVICFVPDVVFQQHRLLMDFRRSCTGLWELMLDICAFQHHGILFLPMSFALNFDNALMPIQAIRKGCLIQSGDSRKFDIRLLPDADSFLSEKSLSSRLKVGEDAIKTRIYKHHGKQGVYLDIDFRNRSDNMYQLFALISYLMLVPALVRESIGQPCYKADSFNDLSCYFSDENVSFIKALSVIRSDWEKCYSNKKTNEVSDWIIERLGENFMERGNVLLKEAIQICREYQ